MTSLCTRCALRFERAATKSTFTSNTFRSLSTSSVRHGHKTIPTFAPSSNPELDQVLASLRDKHFIPRMINNSQRKLIFAPKNKQLLEESPQTVSIGGQDVQLRWIDQRTEIPNRQHLISSALNLMNEGQPSDWQNLRPMLMGLHQTGKPLWPRQYAKAVRLAANKGQFGLILDCLTHADTTGMSLKGHRTLGKVMTALRETGRGRKGGWSKENLEKAIRDADYVARLLEDEKHGDGKHIRPNDPRTRPDVMAVFLELHAVYAVKYLNGKDGYGRVSALADRMLSNMTDTVQVPSNAPEGFPAKYFMRCIPIWHSLTLAQRILGPDIPHPQRAQKVIDVWQDYLQNAARELEAGDVQEGTYDAKALEVWRDCIRD